ncbi:ubiquitin-associated and SH3 domain-containing protein B isoform X2 [Trichoplusia ni]|uniref:Ecdysteroid-phosphate phosphatase n=1 Tax=Trichoplusia ni TaxID=7111 RepID=A0A7E5W2X4_TRINI|nr:ubiquitin-associated and SH3 domain-containing protein B isoform X2 [Trichoplusia ni]
MRRVWCSFQSHFIKMANIPPRKVSSSSRVKQDASPLQILLQMGFPRHRALKALAATGNRSVQLASDWLLTHVNDGHIDADEPREYIFYASPTGPLLNQLLEFWDKSKAISGWNGAHNFPPHITLVSFFKAPDETSLQLGKAVKHVVENVGDPPNCPLKLEPYVSHNFMALFVSDEHADYLKRIAVQYVKQVSSIPINLEAHVKSLHITLAYHFDVAAYDELKRLVDDMQPSDQPGWELRLYSRDPRFANHQVYKVTQGYVPKASDELELVLGDYIYIEEKEFDNSPDGWVLGTSWLTGVSGCLPAVFTRRTAESDAWTLHRAVSLGNNSSDSKSESDSNTDGEMATNYPHEDATQLGHEKSEETYKEWGKYWTAVQTDKTDSILNVTQGHAIDWKANSNQVEGGPEGKKDKGRRWIFAMRHGERVDLTYGQWVPFCFDEDGKYVRKDLNLPLKLGERVGGKESYLKDTPLTRVGRLQAYLVGEGLRLAGVPVTHVYASAALRCVETAHSFLEGLQADPSVKVKVEPGLFEYKMWHLAKGMAPFMTPIELYKYGLNVDLQYKPYIDLDIHSNETLEEYYKRGELVVQSAVKDTENEGGNIIFVGHAATLDVMAIALKRMNETRSQYPEYKIHNNLLRVPYCALGAARDQPYEVVCPPCPPSINSSSGRFDWRMLLDA